MASLTDISAVPATAGAVVLGGFTASIATQRLFGTRIRDLPDEGLKTQVLAATVALFAFNLVLNVVGLVWTLVVF